MLKTFGTVSAHRVLGAILLVGATGLAAVGCGGSDSGSGPSAGAGGDTGDAGDTGEGGNATAGKGGGKGGASGDAGSIGEGGEAGAVIETPAQNHSAVSFVSSGVISKSKNFVLVSGLGESIGGTVGSKRSKSLKYTFVPGVVAASTP